MERMYKTQPQHPGSTFDSVYEGSNSKTNRSIHRREKSFFGRMIVVHEESLQETVFVTTHRSTGCRDFKPHFS